MIPNINYLGVLVLLKGLVKHGRIRPEERDRIAVRVAVQLGADLMIQA